MKVLMTILAFLASMAICEAQKDLEVNWKTIKHIRTKNLASALKLRQVPDPAEARLQYFGPLKTNKGHFERTLAQILRVRLPGTEGSAIVRNFIENEMSNLGWTIEEDAFEQNTVLKRRIKFTNIIATLNPDAPRRMVIACHYDSKLTPEGFLGATDSAVPCAQMINLAHTMQMDLNDHKADQNNDLTLQFIFFDGEEAFKHWTNTDSIYGARHLAAKMSGESYEYNAVRGNSLERIDLFMLLDLLGAKNPKILSLQPKTDPWFRRLIQIESSLKNHGLTDPRVPKIFQTNRARNGGVEDDHVPFQDRNVPILHIITVPFPNEWHTIDDNADVVHLPTVEKLNIIFRIFVSEYLGLA